MRVLRSAVLYVALALGANAAAASDIAALREGDMRKLRVHAEPKAVSVQTFTDAKEREYSLADFEGRYVLLNFWATWCAPCREEMPTINALQQEFGGEDFEVVALAIGRNSLDGIRKFFKDTGVDALDIYLDPQQAVAREMSVIGLPISVLIDREGREIARLTGDADWYSDSARAIVAELIGKPAES